MSEQTVKERTMADGTVQRECQNPRCYHGRWFDVPKTGRPPKFCSSACRVMAHRDEKERQRIEAERRAREERLARLNEEHRAKWVAFLQEHAPRLSKKGVDDLYDAMMAKGMVEAPFLQRELW